MGNWFISAWERIEKAFLVSDRYVAYLDGFKTTLIISLFAGTAWRGRRIDFGRDQIYGESCGEKYHIDISQLDSQYLYRYYPGNSGLCSASYHLFYHLCEDGYIADRCRGALFRNQFQRLCG